MITQVAEAMSRREKLVAALSNHPNKVTFAEVRALLTIEEFTLVRVTGSHHVFSKDDVTLVIPVHKNSVKAVYIKRILDLIEGE